MPAARFQVSRGASVEIGEVFAVQRGQRNFGGIPHRSAGARIFSKENVPEKFHLN
jgi:hypothetical protein